ncbi:MAG: homoserine kinase [Pseudomonadota bacterium]
MAIYTKLTRQEIEDHLTNYKLGTLTNFKEIIEGIDNTNLLIETTQGKFILTIFESRIDKNSLPFFINFKIHLAQKGICCPIPIVANSGASLVDLKNKKSTIVTFLNGTSLKAREDGYYDNITPNHCYEIGKVLARLHLATADFNMSRENELSPLVLRNLFNKIQYLHRNLRAEILGDLDFIEKSWRVDLPSGASHLDLFPDNVFFDNEGKASGVIDFYFAANDLLIYDFAIVVNAWCFDERNNFDQQKFDEMLRGYEEVRKFSAEEKNFLKIALVGAAMRFLLTRLHDMFAVSTESLVKIKNPKEYLAKLRFFKSKV